MGSHLDAVLSESLCPIHRGIGGGDQLRDRRDRNSGTDRNAEARGDPQGVRTGVHGGSCDRFTQTLGCAQGPFGTRRAAGERELLPTVPPDVSSRRMTFATAGAVASRTRSPVG